MSKMYLVFMYSLPLFLPSIISSLDWYNLFVYLTIKHLCTIVNEIHRLGFTMYGYMPACDFTAATTDYIHPFSAALHKDNFYATQFHPEKSGKTGEKILMNFLNI